MEPSHEIRIACEITNEHEIHGLDVAEFRTVHGRFGVMARIQATGDVYSVRTWDNKEEADKYLASLRVYKRSH